MLKSILSAFCAFFLLFILPRFVYTWVGIDFKTLHLIVLILNIICITILYLNHKNKNNYCNEFHLNFKHISAGIILGLLFKIILDPLFNYNLVLGFQDITNLPANNIDFPISALFTLIIIIPISEELLFRQLILTYFLKNTSSLIFSILLGSLLFALIHLPSLNSVINTFFLGLFLSILYLKMNSIILPIVIHIVFNLVSFVFQESNIKDYYNLLEDLDFGLLYWFFIAISALLASVIYKYLINQKLMKHDVNGLLERKNKW